MNDKRRYASVVNDDGVNYRDIADVMSELGFYMNHSSARNHVLRIMRKFVTALAENSGAQLDECAVDLVAKSAEFQHNVSDILHAIEGERRKTQILT
jgi:transposase-like protein